MLAICLWSSSVVLSWMRALDPCLEQYSELFFQKRIDGSKLIGLTHDDLIKWGVTKVGPQAILLEAIDAVSKLSSFSMESETLQSYVSKLAVASTCLTETIQSYVTLLNVIDSDPQNRILYELDKGRYQLDVYSCVVTLIDAARDTCSWLGRVPFSNMSNVDTETMIVKESISTAVRDIIKKFVMYSDSNSDKTPTEVKEAMLKSSKSYDKLLQDIKETSLKLSTTCERYVTHFKDVLAVIPCQIALVNLKKPLNDAKWGITLLTLNNPLPTHIISDVNEESSSTGTSKIQRGDEVLAVGNVPVVCLPHALVSTLIEQAPCDLQIIVKKRPAHTCENQRKHWKARFRSSKPLRKSQSRSSQKKGKGPNLQTVGPYQSMSVPSTPNPNNLNETPPLLEDIELEAPGHLVPPTITLTEVSSSEDLVGGRHSKSSSSPAATSSLTNPREKFSSTSSFTSVSFEMRGQSSTLESPKKRLGSHGGREDYKRISCRLLGNGECSGWLLMKKKSSHMLPANWNRRYCILKHHTLYFYKTENDEKAEGLINMRSYDIMVTPGESNKPDRFPFNIRSHLVSFTFATDTESNRKKWMNKLGLVAIGYQSQTNDDSQIAGFRKAYTSTSETGSSSEAASESSGDEDALSSETPVVTRRVMNPRPLTRILEGIDESNLDEGQKRESDLLRKLLTLKRLERELREREEQLNLINHFLTGPVTKETLTKFLDEHGLKLFNSNFANSSTTSSFA